MLDDHVHVTGAIETVQDITARVLADNELRDSQERYQILAENVADGVGLIQEGRLQFVNDAFARLFGYDNPQTMVGKVAVDLITEADRPAFHRQQTDFKQERLGKYSVDMRGVRKQGDEI